MGRDSNGRSLAHPRLVPDGGNAGALCGACGFVDVRPTVQELIGRLEADGWSLVPQKGSHRQYHPSQSGTVTVAGKPRADIPLVRRASPTETLTWLSATTRRFIAGRPRPGPLHP